MNLNSVMIGSEDAKRLADYYTKLFGEPDWSEQGFTGWQLGAGSLTVGPHDEVKGSNPDPGRIICNIETADVNRTSRARGKACGSRRSPISTTTTSS